MKTVRFNASNRFGNILDNLSDCRLVMFLLMEEDVGRNFSTREIGNTLDGNARTARAMSKRRRSVV